MSAKRFNFADDDRYMFGGDNDITRLLYPYEESNEEADNDCEFLQDVPYSSSSIDRSSIGSIPWADDAIKKNKIDWERVDRLLSSSNAEEEFLETEVELSKEILDWQRKFPQLIGLNSKSLGQQSFESSLTPRNDDLIDIDSISNLSLNSIDDDAEEDGFVTPTIQRQRLNDNVNIDHQQTFSQKLLRPTQNLAKLLDRDLHITSVKLRQRQDTKNSIQMLPNKTQAVSPSSPPAIKMKPSNSASDTRSKLRMPPILNVLDSNRRFRDLLNNKRSFVQLTQVQQAKSAALTHKEERTFQQGQGNRRSAWHVPLVAAAVTNRFFNNRNSIVLPAINMQRIHEYSSSPHATTTISNKNTAFINNSSPSISSDNGAGLRQQPFMMRQTFCDPATNSTTTPSTGRSISAAVHHPRSQFASAFYLPYSASKFKAFK